MSRNQQNKTRRKQNQGQRRQPQGQGRRQSRPQIEGIGEEPSFSQEMRAEGVQKSGSSRSQRSQSSPPGGGPASQLSHVTEQVTESVRKELQPRFESARNAVTKAGQTAARKVKANPVPFALAGVGVVCTGAGITWMLMSQAKEAAAASTSGQGAERSSSGDGQGTAQRLQRTVKDAARAASSKASELAETASTQGRRIESTLEESVQSHPLAVGAAMLAIGTFIGLAIPRSKLEDTWIGRERDQLVNAAQRAARGAAKKVENLAKQVVGPVAQA